MKNKNIFLALGFANILQCILICIIFDSKIYEFGFRKKDKKFFITKTTKPEMYKFLTLKENNYFNDYYLISILTPKENEK